MDSLNWEQNREVREKRALENHERLSRLFREDRLAFERERKRLIDDVINQAENEEQRDRLKELQAKWNKRMRGAGSDHNRLVLAKTFFWEHFHEKWHPTITHLNQVLNGDSE